jgi:hypothetical protein
MLFDKHSFLLREISVIETFSGMKTDLIEELYSINENVM